MISPKIEIDNETGDLMLAIASLARHLDIDPEDALRAANQKFTRGFAAVEDLLAERGNTPKESNLAEMEALWGEVKTKSS